MTSKKICAPSKDVYGYTCFNMQSLKKIATKLNKDQRFGSYKDINVSKYNKNNKKKLVKEIQRKLNCKKHLDFCVLEKRNEFYQEIKSTMKPKGPIDKNEWLSSIDIQSVMEQYEKKYKDFNFIGSQLRQAAIDKGDAKTDRVAVAAERVKEMEKAFDSKD